jgi:hypothetical protein
MQPMTDQTDACGSTNGGPDLTNNRQNKNGIKRSKLSSRRHKRRSVNDRVPIPSFAPIAELYIDVNETSLAALLDPPSKVSEESSAACQSKSNECATETTAKHIYASSNSNDSFNVNENDPFQSSRKSDKKCITHGATEMPSRATLSSSSNPKPSLIAEKTNDETQQIKHTTAAPGDTLDDSHMNTLEELCVDINEDGKKLQIQTNHGKDESVSFCHDGSNSNDKEVLRLPTNERINHGDCNLLANVAMTVTAAVSHDPTHDGRKRRSLKKQNVKRPAGLDVIEILDEVDDGCLKSVLEQPVSSRTDSIDKGNDTQSNSKESNKSKQTRRKRKLSPSVTRSSSESTLKEAEVIINEKKTIVDRTGVKKKVQKNSVRGGDVEKKSKTAGGKKLCYACSTCKCEGRCNADSTSQIFPGLSGSVARQEQSLVNRLLRIERDIAWREGQRYDVARALKKHQLQMLKRYAETNTIDQKPRFLPDADMTDNLLETCPTMSLTATRRAKSRVFGKQKMHQPTLTQIMRGSKDNNDSDDDDGTDEKPPASETTNTVMIDSNCIASDLVDRDDFLSFWADTVPIDSLQRQGTMSYYNDALAKFKDAKNIGKWALATASTIQLEEDEGFGALVDLFDSMVGCNRDSTYDDVDDDNDEDNEFAADTLSYMDPLSPRGEQVATQIVNSVKNDPEKKVAIERMCPNWKENIEYVQAQTDPYHLQTALCNVQLAKAKLESMKNRVLRAFLDRQNTLDMYERSLEGSIDRLRHDL